MVMELIRDSLPEVDLWAGYSIGEVSMYGCAGAFSRTDILSLASLRAEEMDRACSDGGMAAVIGLKEEQIEAICACGNVYKAIVNGADHFILAGLKGNIENAIEDCKKAGASKTVRLNISTPSHTPLMNDAVKPFEKKLASLKCNLPSSPFLAGINGLEVFNEEQMRNALCSQICHTIDWRKCIEAAKDYGCRVFLELGPGNSLSTMVLESDGSLEARSVSEFKDFSRAGQWVKSALERQS